MSPAGPPPAPGHELGIPSHELPSDELEALARILPATDRRNGDDCAVLAVPAGQVCVSVDTAVVGVHLHTALTPAEWGYRAAACALSDLAAMGASPTAILVSVATPTGRWADAVAMVDGARTRAAESGAVVVGGDLVRAGLDDAAPASISVTCLGTPPARGGVVRAGARAGDIIAVTGSLGAAAAEFHSLTPLTPPTRLTRHERGDVPAKMGAYRRPPNRLAAGTALASFTTAMMDISDGLSLDLVRLAGASGCGFEVDLDLLPLSPDLEAFPIAQADPAVTAACWGDDYELLVTLDAAQFEHARAALSRLGAGAVTLTKVGQCADTGTTWKRHGGPIQLEQGFSHR